MKITPNIFSLPPYISTTWQNVIALHVRHEEGMLLLVVDLLNGNRIEIPNLDPATMETIFAMHAAVSEGEGAKPSAAAQKNDLPSLLSLHLPVKFFGAKFLEEGIDKIAGALQHNPEAADTADLPREILDRVANIAQSLGMQDISSIPSPTEGCNCLFCQIARSMQAQIAVAVQSEQEDEEVTAEDLHFKTWDIHQKDHHLYDVVNPLDKNEQYSVFLGSPLGCTCGVQHCEHIRAVLST